MSSPTALASDTRLVSVTGEVIVDGIGRWLGPPSTEEMAVLERAVSPVLDVGCGPGRHVEALAARGVIVLGVDAAPTAVALAHQRGAPVLQRSIFERLSGTGRWASALLLDGNLGIGGDPRALLSRVGRILRPAGVVLVELCDPQTSSGTFMARIENGATVSGWFPWARVSVVDIVPVAGECGFAVDEIWEGGQRWFARLAARSSGGISCRRD
jgi:SAM-dependent methyltransferase